MRLALVLALAVLAFCNGFIQQHFGARSGPASRGVILTMMADVEQKGRVTMYKKTGCPYCEKAVTLLEGKYGLKIDYVDIESEQRDEILSQMRNFSGGANTVPQIFFNSDHLGGNNEVQQLDIAGGLEEKVSTVKGTEVSMMMDGWFHPHY